VGQENQIAVRPVHGLEPFLIQLPPRSVEFRESLQRWIRSHKPTKNGIKTIIAITLNVICTVYQAADVYRRIYPGSKVAANILLNKHTHTAWNAFFWLFAVAATIANMFVAQLWTSWFAEISRIEALLKKILRREFLLLMCSGIRSFIVVPALVFGPCWIVFAYRYAWKAIAWHHECSGWDYVILLDGVSWDPFLSNRSLVGTATILATPGMTKMDLFRDVRTHGNYIFKISQTSNSTLPLSSIAYNLTGATYTANNITSSFNVTPFLSFPSLDIDTRDHSIPFLRPDDKSYPPSADLIYRNSTTISHLLTTELLRLASWNFSDCTKLKACGMQDRTGGFQIALGVVLIEQVLSSLYCTLPSNSTVPLL